MAQNALFKERRVALLSPSFFLFNLFLGISSLSLSGGVVISEFMASNDVTLEDEDGDDEDWIEITNDSSEAVNLLGYYLTDDAENLTKWRFPEVTVSPGAVLVVFASNKNRDDPEEQLHTNFKLSSDGEYLALVKPDGLTVEHDYGPKYPQQIEDISYGLEQGSEDLVLLNGGAQATYIVPSDDSLDVKNGSNPDSWINPDLDDSSWTAGPTGHGFAVSGNDPYDEFIGTDVQTDLLAKQTTVYIRIPFNVENPATLYSPVLGMRYDDGFVAYLNGNPLPIAEANSPSADELNFESRATESNPDGDAIEEVEFPIDRSLFLVGENVLSIHGLNRSAGNSDALFAATMAGLRVTGTEGPAYFSPATPGAPNIGGKSSPGPGFRTVTNNIPPLDLADGSLLVEAAIEKTLHPITEVEMTWRVMYGAETKASMNDSGNGGDKEAGDGIYSATIPLAGLDAGEMIRWKISATDSMGAVSLAPPFNDPLDSPEYFGTIAEDSSVESSNLPIFHWFTSSPSGSNTPSGARGSVYYLGEFYDNIQADRHGQSTGGFPKKSFDFDFNKGDRFLPYEDGRRAKDINMLTNWADKSKVRNTIGYEIMRKSGHPAHYAFPVRIQQNAQFFSVADLVEDGDDRYLERVDLDGDGALYKMYNRMDSSRNGVNKKTRKDENNDDLQEFITGLALGGDGKKVYGYDNLNIPATINYLAALDMTNNRDHGHKNYYVYRDTNGTGEWRPLVWDIDLNMGRNWRSGPAYFDDVFRNNALRAGPTNRLKQFIFNDATLNQMFLRRVRTLMDELYGPIGAPVDYLSNRVNEVVDLVDPTDDAPQSGSDDADLDYQKWGSWGNRNAVRPAADRILDEYIPTRRSQLYGLNEIPSGQPAMPTIMIGIIDYNPVVSGASQDQDGEYLQLKNPNNFAVDCSEWTLTGGIELTLPPGAVIPANSELYVGREASGFRNRTAGPTGGEKRYLVSGYQGQLSARGETITLSDKDGNVIDTETYVGDPTDLQVALRVSEILYAPVEPTSAELMVNPFFTASDFEFIEIMNIGDSPINLSGARFIEGVSMTFSEGANLEADQRGIVVANLQAFEARYGFGFKVLGEYFGNLSNGGEQIQIVDPSGENILEFTYADDWYEDADGMGFSLEVKDPAATALTDFDRKENWQVSEDIGGTPPVDPFAPTLTYGIWKSENFNAAELANPLVTGIDVDLDGDGMGTLLEYAFGMKPRIANKPRGYQISAQEVDGKSYMVLSYRRQKLAGDLSYLVQSSLDMENWETQSNAVGVPVDNGDDTETVSIRDGAPITDQLRRFFRIKVQLK